LARPAISFGVDEPLWYEILYIISPSERFLEGEEVSKAKSIGKFK
jgi:hypothetical protein